MDDCRCQLGAGSGRHCGINHWAMGIGIWVHWVGCVALGMHLTLMAWAFYSFLFVNHSMVYHFSLGFHSFVTL